MSTDLTIKPIAQIKEAILLEAQGKRNFPKTLAFPFDPLYVEMVTAIRTTEISSECILFDAVQSLNMTRDFADPDYWTENYPKEEVDKYWFFAQNGQGDLWLFDNDGQVYFYDHNLTEMCGDNFVKLDLDFGKWLQFAELNRQLDKYYDVSDTLTEEQRMDYQNCLRTLSGTLLANYPFEI